MLCGSAIWSRSCLRGLIQPSGWSLEPGLKLDHQPQARRVVGIHAHHGHRRGVPVDVQVTLPSSRSPATGYRILDYTPENPVRQYELAQLTHGTITPL